MKPDAKRRIVVTGGSGKAGRACVHDLLDHGYEVINVDSAPWRDSPCRTVIADLRDFGQTIDVLSSAGHFDLGPSLPPPFDGIVHLAAIPAPGIRPDAETFANNTLSTYNVFEAARRLAIRNIVWASSETVLGLPFDEPPPYVPVDEDYPGRPQSAYSLSKLMGEEMAKQFCRWDPTTKIIGLRFSNVMEPHDYARFPAFDSDAGARKWNLWGYIDARDAAQAVRKSLEAPITGAEVFIIAAPDTVMSRSNTSLLAEVFPNAPKKRAVGDNETLLSIAKAQEMLGYAPQYCWREQAKQTSCLDS